MHSNRQGPLTNLRVIDISTMIAAPYAATLLADLGAEVTKVELPGTGDTSRHVGPFCGKEPLRWPGLNRNKQCMTLDLRKEEGRGIFLNLIKKYDILIENFRPGTLERWGLGADVLMEANPGLILVRISGYGQTGPYSGRAGFGTPATAFSGYTYLQGYPDRPPVSPSFSLTDYVAGVYAAFGALAALHHRESSPDRRGQVVDVSLYEGIFRMMEFLVAEYDKLGKVRERAAGLTGHSAPSGTFQTADGHWIVIVTSTDSTFNRLAQAMGREEMTSDPRYSTNAERLKRADEVNGMVREFVASRSRQEILELLDAHGVPASPIYSIRDIMEDPHYKARENVVELPHPRLGTLKVPGVFPKFSRTPGAIHTLGRDLGQDTCAILQTELELSQEQIEDLKARGVI